MPMRLGRADVGVGFRIDCNRINGGAADRRGPDAARARLR